MNTTYIGLAEVARRLNISRITAWRMLRDGSFPSAHRVRERGPWRIDPKDITAWKAKHL